MNIESKTEPPIPKPRKMTSHPVPDTTDSDSFSVIQALAIPGDVMRTLAFRYYKNDEHEQMEVPENTASNYPPLLENNDTPSLQEVSENTASNYPPLLENNDTPSLQEVSENTASNYPPLLENNDTPSLQEVPENTALNYPPLLENNDTPSLVTNDVENFTTSKPQGPMVPPRPKIKPEIEHLLVEIDHFQNPTSTSKSPVPIVPPKPKMKKSEEITSRVENISQNVIVTSKLHPPILPKPSSSDVMKNITFDGITGTKNRQPKELPNLDRQTYMNLNMTGYSYEFIPDDETYDFPKQHQPIERKHESEFQNLEDNSKNRDSGFSMEYEYTTNFNTLQNKTMKRISDSGSSCVSVDLGDVRYENIEPNESMASCSTNTTIEHEFDFLNSYHDEFNDFSIKNLNDFQDIDEATTISQEFIEKIEMNEFQKRDDDELENNIDQLSTMPKTSIRKESILRKYYNRKSPKLERDQSIDEEEEIIKKSVNTKRRTSLLEKLRIYRPSKVSVNPNELITQTQAQAPITPELFQRPIFNTVITEFPENIGLFYIPDDKQNWQLILKNGLLEWYCGNEKKQVILQDLLSVCATNLPIVQSNLPATYYMEIVWYSHGQKMPQTQLFGAPNPLMRDIWMQQIFESVTDCFPKYLTSSFTLAGWIYIRKGLAKEWSPCWMLLKGRELFCCKDKKSMKDEDLRKARCIVPKFRGGLQDDARYVWLDLQDRSYYLQALTEKDTNCWGRNIRTAALCNGTTLEQQQLTKENVPVLVQKCINFISRRGMTQEGIYRKHAFSSEVYILLQELRSHAWATQVTEVRYTAQDVASALLRFFKELPEPLIRQDITYGLCGVASMNYSNEEDKIVRYRLTLSQLPSIHFLTSRRLFGHLYFIQIMSAKNKMTANDLANVWTPVIMKKITSVQQKNAVLAVTELITLYPKIYEVSMVELQRERAMLSLIDRLQKKVPEVPLKDSGDLRIWITLGNTESTDGIFVTVNPHKTAGEVCREIKHTSSFTLQEFILNGVMRRPLHPSVKVFEVVVRWGYWSEEHRKNNQLVLGSSHLYNQLLTTMQPSTEVAINEYKFADCRSKSFKNYFFEVKNGKIICYKDRKLTSKVNEWKVTDIIWYIGFEPKRDPETSWAITFINRQHKSTSKYFGNTIAGNKHNDYLSFCSSLLCEEYPPEEVQAIVESTII